MTYRPNEHNACPGCNRSQWIVGRSTSECAFCGTAVLIATPERSQHERIRCFGNGGGKVSGMVMV